MQLQAEINLQQGNLSQALTELQNQIRKDPSNSRLRVFLFQLLAVTGQWERSLTQLKVVGELDALALLMVKTYQAAIVCEAFRSDVFAGKRSPLVFGEPPVWLAQLLEALRLDAETHYIQAKDMREQALELAPATGGIIDGQRFEWLADADNRLGPILEAIVKGQYYWIPLQNIQKVEIEKPVDLRDAVWTPVQFTWINGGQASGLIPTRYPGSESSADNLIQLARKTDWLEYADGLYLGQGQRLLATNVDDYPLMDIREISFDN